MTRTETGVLAAVDGVQLHLKCWQAPDHSRGVVVLVHGFGEHIGRYDMVADFLEVGGGIDGGSRVLVAAVLTWCTSALGPGAIQDLFSR